MRIAVTGGTGKLGRSLLPFLAAQPGASIRALARTASAVVNDSVLAPLDIEWVEGDLASTAVCEALVADQDAIVHLAHTNAPLTSDRDVVSDAQLNLVATLTLLQSIRRLGRKTHVVFSSSGGAIYAECSKRVPFVETSLCAPQSSYGIQKLAAEHYLRLFAERGHLSACVLRVSTAYGWLLSTSSQQGLIGVALNQAIRGAPIRVVGSMENVRDYVFVDDVCEAMVRALGRRRAFEIFNVGSGSGTSVAEVLEIIAKVVDRSLDLRQESWQFAQYLPTWSVLDVGKAAEDLDWRPHTSLEAGVRRILERKA